MSTIAVDAVPPSSASLSSASASAEARPLPLAPIAEAGGATSSCRTVRGPIELPVRTPAALAARATTIDVALNDEGRPRVTAFDATPVSASSTAPSREPFVGGAVLVPRAPRVPCSMAGDVTFCPDPAGAVHRVRSGGEEQIVASARTGTRATAAMLGGTHTALAYLASRKTTEGWVSEAWLAVDDELPVRLSEDGSGATAVDLASRGASLLALSVDARTALTAMHARPIGYEHGARLGEDVVTFVGGPGDRRTAATLAISRSGLAWALLPIARDTEDFGLAAVRLDEPPHVDEPVLWSMYPNGLDPASVASAAVGGKIWVARVRPEAAVPAAPHVLELGDLSTDGTFTQRSFIPTAENPGDVSLAADARGALWLAWVDGAGSWLERLACR